MSREFAWVYLEEIAFVTRIEGISLRLEGEGRSHMQMKWAGCPALSEEGGEKWLPFKAELLFN
jgi:hypothetical protein